VRAKTKVGLPDRTHTTDETSDHYSDSGTDKKGMLVYLPSIFGKSV